MKNTKEKYAWLVLLTFATGISFFVGADGRNLLLIGLMIFVFPLLLLKQFPSFHSRELPLFLLAGYMLLSGVIHPETFRIATVLYACMFILAFIYYLRLIYSGSIDFHSYEKILVWLLASYCIVLLAQQICVLFGLPVINFMLGNLEEFKLNSLSVEPSHSARIIALLMYSFICVKEVHQRHSYDIVKSWRTDKWLWFFFLYPMLTMQSGTAFVLLVLFGAKLLRWRTFLIVSFFVLLAGGIAYSQEFEPLIRAVRILEAFATFDEARLVAADHSASLRVLPTMIYLKSLDLWNPDYWFGFGVDYNATFFYGLIPGIKLGSSIGAVSSAFLIDYGLVAGVFLLIAIFGLCIRKNNWFDLILVLFFVGATSFNSQIFWLCLMLLATNKYLYRRARLANMSPGLV